MTENEGGAGSGPDRIRSIAVHREDVANALEATLRSDREVVLRVTPPFSGRMRARLHAVDANAGDGSDPSGRAGDALFVLWPLSPPPDPRAIPPGEFFVYYLWSPSFFVEVAVWAGAVALAVRAVRARADAA